MQHQHSGTPTRVRFEGHVMVAACDHLVLNRGEATEIAAAVRDGMSDSARRIVLHFVAMESPSANGVGLLARELMEVVRMKGQILIVGHQAFERCIREQGLDRLFGWAQSVETLLAKEGVLKHAASKSATDFLNASITAISRSMQDLLSTKVAPGRPFLRKSGEFAGRLEIALAMPLQSTPFSGSLYVAFSRNAYSKLAMKLLGQPISELDPSYAQVGGALLPLMQATVREELSDAAFGFHEREGHVLASMQLTEIFGHLPPSAIVIPFETDSGPFCLILVAGATAAQTSAAA